MARRRDETGSAAMVVGVVALVVFFLAILVVIVSLAFSVRVSGHSMEPTLHDGDRLEVDLLHRHDIARFDVVEAVEPASPGVTGGKDIVKRVIGLPGDRVAIAGGAKPVVYLRPAGTTTTYVVDNPAWSGQVGAKQGGCCGDNGVYRLHNVRAKRWQTVPDGSYWLIGDNWGGSTDSRVFGFVSEESIKAKLSFRIQPFGRFGHLDDPATLAHAK
ncbi:signal peptidase I [Nocardioides sp. DS6]|uniref:Signal peptidase I n=1 Tax=Nocardioides eburneus TaxID=3231482 RepID=A0ABV3T0E1_9ACTN